MTGHVSVASNSYGAVMDAIANTGPLAVSVDAGAWHDYETGIFDGGNHTNPDLGACVRARASHAWRSIDPALRAALRRTALSLTLTPSFPCTQTCMLPDHLVQMVGYGTATAEEGGGDYFLIRNSWTPLWGEDGYIRLARSSSPSCGTDLTPLDGNGCTGGPPTVEVCGQSGVLYDCVYPTVVQ